jgi:hypothetical protein
MALCSGVKEVGAGVLRPFCPNYCPCAGRLKPFQVVMIIGRRSDSQYGEQRVVFSLQIVMVVPQPSVEHNRQHRGAYCQACSIDIHWKNRL